MTLNAKHTTRKQTTMTSIYSTYADHNADLIATRWNRGNDAGNGMGWGSESMTPREAADDMGAIVIHEYTNGRVLAELSDRLYMVCDVNGPWAVEVATQEDLGTTATPKFSAYVLAALEETGGNWRDDADDLRAGKVSRESLLAYCQNGVETDDDMALWAEYVTTLAAAVL
jgi:hypothetical protein